MAQWVNRLRNNIFVYPPPLPLLCEISGALHLAQPGLTAGRQAGGRAGCGRAGGVWAAGGGWAGGWVGGRQAGRQAGKQAGRLPDEIQVNFEIF